MRCTQLLCLLLLFLSIKPSEAQVFSFTNSECAPPCWRGLIAGESSAAEAAALLDSDSNANGQFDENGILLNGVYEFEFEPIDHYTPDTIIEIRDGVVDKIFLNVVSSGYEYSLEGNPHLTINMRMILENLGQPDFVHFASYWAEHNGELLYSFIYVEERLRILFYEPRESIHDGFQCQMNTIQDDLEVYQMYFYSENAAIELQSYRGYAESYPALMGFPNFERNVPSETWNAVMNSELDGSCNDINIPFDWSNDTPIEFAEATGQSLFPEDSCAPPCVFGLIVGETSKEEVRVFSEATSFVFRNWQYNHEGQFFHTRWLYRAEEEIYLSYNNTFSVGIVDEIVNSIYISPSRVILLSDIFEAYGNPVFREIWYADPISETVLTLYYPHLGLIIYLRGTRNCNFAQMTRDFWVQGVSYHAVDSPITRPYYTRGALIEGAVWNKMLGTDSFSCRNLAIELNDRQR